MSGIEIFFATGSLTVAIFGSLFAWIQWRSSELRRDEVLRWANECIESLQSLCLISTLNDPALDKSQIDEIRIDIIFKTSSLIEKGRIFFKNEVIDDFGANKCSAYRGYRPRILDHLVVAHKIARCWPNESSEEALRRSVVARECLKNFVSLAQKEVGRGRAASAETLKGGNSVDLPSLLSAVEIDGSR